jgi:Fe-S oxidoreductase
MFIPVTMADRGNKNLRYINFDKIASFRSLLPEEMTAKGEGLVPVPHSANAIIIYTHSGATYIEETVSDIVRMLSKAGVEVYDT